MKKLFLLFITILAFQTSKATHITGAEMWYEHDTLNTYFVHLRIHGDCTPGNVVLGPTQTILVQSNSLSTNMIVTVDTAGSNVPNNGGLLSSCIPTYCLNPQGIAAIELWHYIGQVTLPNAATDWEFYFSDCCRNTTTNLVGQPGTVIRASLDNASVSFNNAPECKQPQDYYHFINTTNSMSFACAETDGDSLDYRLAPVMSGLGSFAPYQAFYNGLDPISNPFNPSNIVLNQHTGLMTFTPTYQGTFVIGIEVREFRNGNLISTSLRDYQIAIVGIFAPNSNLPTLTGINGTPTFIDSVNVCGTAAINFTVNSNDADIADSTTIQALVIPSGASFTTNTAQNQLGTFTWSPTANDVRTQPYNIVLEVQDNNCGKHQAVYQLYVNDCTTDSVWAGDANADFTCNNFDVLNIGIANSVTGPVRVGATTNWQAEWCANWSNNFMNNINQKHADCNGDGVVNAADLAAVAANFGLVHNKTSQVGQYKTAGLPDLYCDLSTVQAYKGSTVTIPVMLGTTSSEMNDFYGISATVELLNAQTSTPISISKNTSWIGNATNSFSFEKSLAQNKAAFTFVRNNQTNLMAQQGQIGEIIFPIDLASADGSEVTVQFSDIKIIKNTGEEIHDYNVLADKLTILAAVGIGDKEKGFSVNVYPNPTKSKMTISLNVDKTQSYEIALYDVVGRLIDNNIFSGSLDTGEHNLELDLSNKAAGQYQLEIKSEGGITVLPIVKL